MNVIKRILPVMIAIGAMAGLCVPADAAMQTRAYRYSGKRVKVYCGIVELAHMTTPATVGGSPGMVFPNSGAIDAVTKMPVKLPNGSDCVKPDGTPYYTNLFAVLDSLSSMKPAGWTFENPLALTQDKYDPQYWRVRVGSARNLSRLNILYFPASGSMSLTDEERENLRRFVDNGGILWVDNASQTSPLKFLASGPFFIEQLSFDTPALGPGVAKSRHHPLLCSPYWLADDEIMKLGMIAANSDPFPWLPCYCKMGITSMSGTGSPAFDVLFPIVDSLSSGDALAGTPSVVANAYGSGRVVATANFAGLACILDPSDGTRRDWHRSMPSLKLAYNIMSYASSWTDIRKNPRHSGSSIDTLGSNRLVEKWSLLTEPGGSGPGKENAPLIYKDTVFYTVGNTLYALDANGNTQYGAWGPPTAEGAVVIWQWPPAGAASGSLSAPTIATMQNPNQNQSVSDCSPIEAVLVQDDQGTVFVLPAFPINPVNNAPEIPITPLYRIKPESSGSGGSGTTSKWPSPPIYINGWIYSLGGDGRIYARNPCSQKLADQGGNPPAWDWALPSPLDKSFGAEPRCGPSFGFIKNANSGAIVGMVYWWTGPQKNGLITDINDRMWGVPVSVSMDRVRLQNFREGRTVCEAVVSHIGWLTATNLRIFAPDGVTEIPATVVPNTNANDLPVAGYMKVTTLNEIPSGALAYASYSLSYDETVLTNPLSLQIDPQSPPTGAGFEHNPTQIAGTPAMGPDNMMFICGNRPPKSTEPAGGSILAYRTDGVTGNSKLRWHYFLHSGVMGEHAKDYIPLMNIELPGVVQGPVGPMMNPQPCSSPAVAGDKVFVTVSEGLPVTGGAPPSTGGPKAALLCFKANPEFVIRITENGGFDASGDPTPKSKSLWRSGGRGHYDVKLWQPNLINLATGAAPVMDARPPGNGINVDYDNGTITFTDFALTKLAARGSEAWLTNNFSPSLPVWVFLDNVEVPIDWSKWGPGALKLGGVTPPTTGPAAASSDAVDLSSWNNLLWYYIVPDRDGQRPIGAHSPVVIGNTVYFIVDTQDIADSTKLGSMLYTFDTETGESSGKETKAQPIWSRQVGTAGIPEGLAESVAGSNGVLLVPSYYKNPDTGSEYDALYAFSNTPTLVTDNNRVVELDGDGEVTWAVDSISWPATTPAATGKVIDRLGPVNKPSRARYANTGEVLFANSGANQVCKIDKDGNVRYAGFGGLYQRWIYSKFADPKHLLRAGQPTQLRAPTDAIMWEDTEPPSANPYVGTKVTHCLIADSGNSRILDLVYRVHSEFRNNTVESWFVKYDGSRIDPGDAQYIDADSGFVMPELNWVTKTDSLNERYAFNCLQLVAVPNSDPFQQDIWVASSNYAANGTTNNPDPVKGRAGLGGAVLAIGYRAITGSGGWSYDAPTSGTITARCDRVTLGGNSVPLANPRFIDLIPGAAHMALIICDNYGVYQVDLDGSAAPPVVASLLEKDYRYAVRKLGNDPAAPSDTPPSMDLQVPLQATSVQRLHDGHWLIANSYSGSNTDGTMKFGGEVFEFDPTAGSGPLAIPWCSPRLQWVAPDSWKQVTTNTYNLRQPKSAFR